MKSQNKQIKQFLLSGRKITAMDALHLCNCFRLAARIYDLRDEGLDIPDPEIIEMMSGGRKKRFARYSIKKT